MTPIVIRGLPTAMTASPYPSLSTPPISRTVEFLINFLPKSTMSATSLSLSSRIKLNNGVSMPRIHLGVHMSSGRETEAAVRWALEAGYYAIDSAEWYANEHEVGSAVRAFLESKDNTQGLKRGDIWFTTKLKMNTGYEATRRAIKQSIRESGLEYVDLYLLHSPYGGRKRRLDCWAAVEDAVRDGEVRSAGVSNYGVHHASIVPVDW
jgi:diketogulonate reductase-like aldo/keto reductase